MGVLRFLVPARDRLPPDALSRIYLTGLDEVPWGCRSHWYRDELLVTNQAEESGYLHTPWRTDAHGELILSTATLLPVDEPYVLPLEIARGTLNRLANRLGDWQVGGFECSPAVRDALRAAMKLFSQAATSGHDLAFVSATSQQVIDAALQLAERVLDEVVHRLQDVARVRGQRMRTLLGCDPGGLPLSPHESKLFRRAFDTAVVSVPWRNVEWEIGDFHWDQIDAQLKWCQKMNLPVVAGPLLQLSAVTLPDWLYLWEDDVHDVTNYAVQYVQRFVERYAGRVSLWHVASRGNVAGALSLAEEARLQLVASVVEAVHRLDAQTPLMIGIDRPWGEYMAAEHSDLSPLAFADALVRADLGVSAIALEMNFAFSAKSSPLRDPLEITRLLELWSTLGLPLMVILSAPATPWSAGATHPVGEPPPFAAHDGNSGGDLQQHLMQRLIPFFLAHRAVQGIIWNQWSDRTARELEHAGLVDGDGRAKPALGTLAELRSAAGAT